MKTAVLLALAALLAPAVLRYKYVVGQERTYSVIEETVTTVQIGIARPAPTQQSNKTVVHTKVISVTGGKAVVEERRDEGQTDTRSAAGLTHSLSPPQIRRMTITPLGKVLSVEAQAIPGVKQGGGFMEGFSVPVPEKAVAEGAYYSSSCQAKGLDGKPITVNTRTQYIGEVPHAGHPCAKLLSTFASKFQYTAREQPAGGSNPAPAGPPPEPVRGVISGKITSYLARDIGQDARIDLEFEMTLTGKAPDGSARVAITKGRTAQTLTK